MTTYWKSIEEIRMEGRSAVTLGKFDGLHRGHQKLLKEVIGRSPGLKSVIFSFEMAGAHLMTEHEQRRFLEGYADILIHCPFTEEIRMMSADDFVKNILVDKLHAGYICVGDDFRFGHMAQGNAHLLSTLGEKYGFQVFVAEKEKLDGVEISSSYIKDSLRKGNMELAQELLGYTYEVSGTIIKGRQIGRTIGFPTMNVAVEKDKILPVQGVYVCHVFVEDGVYEGVVSIGTNPTVTEEGKIKVEAYAFDFDKSVYGSPATIYLEHYIRPEYKLSGRDELREYIESDKRYAVEWFSKHGQCPVQKMEQTLNRNR